MFTGILTECRSASPYYGADRDICMTSAHPFSLVNQSPTTPIVSKTIFLAEPNLTQIQQIIRIIWLVVNFAVASLELTPQLVLTFHKNPEISSFELRGPNNTVLDTNVCCRHSLILKLVLKIINSGRHFTVYFLGPFRYKCWYNVLNNTSFRKSQQ